MKELKMLVIVIFYGENHMRRAMIVNYFLEFFSLRSSAKKHVIHIIIPLLFISYS